MPTSSSPRLVSVDVLRGITIAFMILVNDPGDWGHVYRQLDHSPWNGFTLTDFVFPNFLFLVGVSIIVSRRARIARHGGELDGSLRRRLALRASRRALVLFAIDLFIATYPNFHLSQLRLFGVLTRIAVCYLAAALVCLWTRRGRTLAMIAAALLVGYWALMRFVPVPGAGVPGHAMALLDPERNLAAWIDRGFTAWTHHWLHTGVLYNGTHDPEGILSTLPAIATTLIGCIAGLAIAPADDRQRGGGRSDPLRTMARLAVSGCLLVICGLVWNAAFPINKNLWTSSYVLFAGGWSLLLLALFYWAYDLRRAQATLVGRWLTLPWVIFGANAITAYVVSELVVDTLLAIRLANPADPARPITAWLWLYRHVFAVHGSTDTTSVAFAIVFTALCILPNWWLWRRKVFLRV